MKKEILKMLYSGDKLDLNKFSLFITTIAGVVFTGYAVVVESSFAEVFFLTMIGASAGTTISKGIVDTAQMKIEREEDVHSKDDQKAD